MVVMFVIAVFVVNGTFHTIPTVQSYGAGVFVPTRMDLAVKLKSFYPKLACTIPTGFKFCEVLLPLVTFCAIHFLSLITFLTLHRTPFICFILLLIIRMCTIRYIA